jgi:predicted nucleotidyltransferase
LIETLISSKTRIKLLLKFFLNSSTTGYLRSLEDEFNESSNSVRLELNRFEKAGMLDSELIGNKKVFKANTSHPLFNEVKNIVLKYVGIDKIVDNIANNLGDVHSVYLTGDFAKGKNSEDIDIVIVGDINEDYLQTLIIKTKNLVNRNVRYTNYSFDEVLININLTNKKDYLLLWSK